MKWVIEMENSNIKLFSCHLWKTDYNEKPVWDMRYLIQAKNENEAEEIVKEMKKEWNEMNVHFIIKELDMNKRIQSI